MVKILELMIVIVLFFVAIAVVRLFVTWEREGKAHLAPLVLLGMLVIEGTLYADPITIPRASSTRDPALCSCGFPRSTSRSR